MNIKRRNKKGLCRNDVEIIPISKTGKEKKRNLVKICSVVYHGCDQRLATLHQAVRWEANGS
jgi:hypothetical protein